MFYFVLLFIIVFKCNGNQPKIHYIQQHYDDMGGYHTFINSHSNGLIFMKDCFPLEIKCLINNVTNLYSEYEENNQTQSFALNKMFRDLINYKPFCLALKDGMDIYIKKMSSILNKLLKDNVKSKSIRTTYDNFNIFEKCKDEFKNNDFNSIHSSGMTCLKLVERNALFYALRDKTIFDEKE
jgi:hypothetical protein